MEFFHLILRLLGQLHGFGKLTHEGFVCLFLTLEVRSSDAPLLKYGYLYSYTEFDLTYTQVHFWTKPHISSHLTMKLSQ